MFWEIKIISNKVSDYYQVLVIRINPDRNNTSTGEPMFCHFFKGGVGHLTYLSVLPVRCAGGSSPYLFDLICGVHHGGKRKK